MDHDKSSYKAGDKFAWRRYTMVQIDEGVQISNESNCVMLPSAQIYD